MYPCGDLYINSLSISFLSDELTLLAAFRLYRVITASRCAHYARRWKWIRFHAPDRRNTPDYDTL